MTTSSSTLCWDKVAQAYTTDIVPIFEHFSRSALGLVAPASGAHILDVACGPGTLALQAAAAGSRVTAVDLSPGMIEQLHLRAAALGLQGVDCIVADGQSLPVASEMFDAAFSMFGLVFFPDWERGCRELWRALRPGGRVAVSCWAPVESTPFLEIFWSCLRESFLLPAPPVLARSPQEALRQELEAAGFGELEVHPLSQRMTRESVEEALAWVIPCSPQLLLIQEKYPRQWEPFIEHTQHRLTEVFGSGPVHIDLKAFLAVGRRFGGPSNAR